MEYTAIMLFCSLSKVYSWSVRFVFSGKSLKSKSRYCCECTLYSKESVLHYYTNTNKVTGKCLEMKPRCFGAFTTFFM